MGRNQRRLRKHHSWNLLVLAEDVKSHFPTRLLSDRCKFWFALANQWAKLPLSQSVQVSGYMRGFSRPATYGLRELFMERMCCWNLLGESRAGSVIYSGFWAENRFPLLAVSCFKNCYYFFLNPCYLSAFYLYDVSYERMFHQMECSQSQVCDNLRIWLCGLR